MKVKQISMKNRLLKSDDCYVKSLSYEVYEYVRRKNRTKEDFIIKFNIKITDLRDVKNLCNLKEKHAALKLVDYYYPIEDYMSMLIYIYTDIMLKKFPNNIKDITLINHTYKIKVKYNFKVISSILDVNSLNLALPFVDIIQNIVKRHDFDKLTCYEVEKLLCLCIYYLLH